MPRKSSKKKVKKVRKVGVNASAWARQDDDSKEKTRLKTMQWLEQNYFRAPSVCLLRKNVYEHYVQFCKQESLLPGTNAVLGKLISFKFPDIGVRRLGARGESQYYYMGMDIDLNSSHHEEVSQGSIDSIQGKPKVNRV